MKQHFHMIHLTSTIPLINYHAYYRANSRSKKPNRTSRTELNWTVQFWNRPEPDAETKQTEPGILIFRTEPNRLIFENSGTETNRTEPVPSWDNAKHSVNGVAPRALAEVAGVYIYIYIYIFNIYSIYTIFYTIYLSIYLSISLYICIYIYIYIYIYTIFCQWCVAAETRSLGIHYRGRARLIQD